MSHVHHRNGDEACFGCRIKGVQFAASATPTRHPSVQQNIDAEARLEKDLPAYKRLRADGLQPQSTRGAHELEARAATKSEIEGTPEMWDHRAELMTADILRAEP